MKTDNRETEGGQTGIHHLVEYVLKHTKRGACQCGKCADAPEKPETHQPTGHTVDLVFFKVAAVGNPDPEKFRTLVALNHRGEFADVDLLDGKEHNCLEIGGWIGDQGLGLQLMGLGSLLGLWDLLTPKSIFGDTLPDDTAMSMAGAGYVSIQKA